MEPWQLDLVGGLQQGVGTGRDWSSFQPKLWFCESSVLFLTVASRGYQQRGLPEPGVHSLCWRTLHFLSLSYSVVWIRAHFMAPTAFCLRNFTVNCILWRATYFLLNMLLAIFVRRNSKHTVPYALSLCHSWVCSIRFHSFNVLTPPLKLLFYNFSSCCHFLSLIGERIIDCLTECFLCCFHYLFSTLQSSTTHFPWKTFLGCPAVLKQLCCC